jgi:hypothetical protein
VSARGPLLAVPAWSVDGHVPRVVTGTALRAAVAVLALTAVLVVVVSAGGSGLRLLGMLVVAGVVAGMVVSPTSPLATVFVLLSALVLLDAGRSPWLALPVGALLHAVHVGVAWCAVVAPDAQVDLAALRPSAVRWALTQVLCLPVAVVVLLTGGAGGPGWWSGPAALAAGLLLAVAGVLLAWLARRGTRGPDASS